jgi:hypothetical protein
MTDQPKADGREHELHGRERREAELDELWRMSAKERQAALLAGRLTTLQLSAWRAKHPEEIPPDDAIRAAQDEALWSMTHAERVAAMQAGELTEYQLFAWSIRRPHEVPRIGGEFAWIVHRTADWIESLQQDSAASEAARD